MHLIHGLILALILAVQHWAGHINWMHACITQITCPTVINICICDYFCVCVRFKCQMKNSLDSWSCAWPTTHFSLEREILQLWLIGKQSPPADSYTCIHTHSSLCTNKEAHSRCFCKNLQQLECKVCISLCHRAILKELGLQREISASQARRKWENLKMKYKVCECSLMSVQ